MTRLATLRDVLLEHTPTRRDWWVIAWLACLLVAQFGVGALLGRDLPEPLAALQLPVAALAGVGPAAVVGHRRASPVVALGVTYAMAVFALVASGNWRLTVGGVPDYWWWFHYRTLVFQGPLFALGLTVLGYPAGLVAYGLRHGASRLDDVTAA